MESSKVNPQLTHGSLFSGIGGIDLAAEMVGWTNMFYCEIDSFCQTILKYHFPDAQQYSDIKTIDFSQWEGKIDVLSGGFPCQPFSQAGKRRGTEDNRYLWPEMLRAIRQIKPRWIVGENVLGIVNWSDGLVFEQVCADLEVEGYKVQPFVLPACGINAPHRRYRTFFVAYSQSGGGCRRPQETGCTTSRQDGESSQQPLFGGEVRDASCSNDRTSGFFGHTAFNAYRNLHCPAERTSSEEQNGVSSVDRQTDSAAGQPCRADNGTDERCIGESFVTNPKCSGRCKIHDKVQSEQPNGNESDSDGNQWNVADSDHSGGGTPQCGIDSDWAEAGGKREQSLSGVGGCCQVSSHAREQRLPDWAEFPTQSPVCRGDDGISSMLDADAIYQGRTKVNRKFPFARWRTESIKGYGNAVVPPLICRIFEAINQYELLLWEQE